MSLQEAEETRSGLPEGDAEVDDGDADQTVTVVLVTAPPEGAASLADALVGERLAACVNVIPGVTSVYRWKGDVHHDPEVLLVVKTTAARLPALMGRLPELHPYEVPEILALPVGAGLGTYMDWIAGACAPDGDSNGA